MSLIARLVEIGAPADVIEEVAMLLADQKALERSREKARIRQQEKRDRDAGHVTSRDVTECHSDPALSRPPNEKISNPPTHTHPDIYTTRAKADPFPRPDWCDPLVWTDFLANRKAKRLPNTASAHAKLLRDVEHWAARTGWPPGDVLKACVERGWGAVYDFTEQKNDGRQRQHHPPSTRDAVAGARELLASAAARHGHGTGGIGPVPDALRAIGNGER